jgi:RNA polymerase sigma-70 factor (ECF subfamily)
LVSKKAKPVGFLPRLIGKRERFLAEQAGIRDPGGRLGKLLAGDHEAFAEFVEKYKNQVFLCCRTLGLRDDEAEDVASETFLAAYKGLGRYKGRAELGTWLWTIAYRQGVNYLRRSRRWRKFLAQAQAEPANAGGPQIDEGLESTEQAELVWRAVDRLPRLWAMAIVLHYRQGKTTSQIAKIMSKRQNTIKTYLFRGRQRLKALLAGALREDIDV